MRILDGLSGVAQYGVHNPSLINLKRAVAERVLFTRNSVGNLVPTIKPKLQAFKRLSGVIRAIRRNTTPTTPVPLESYPSLYRGRKRIVYERAVASLIVGAVTKRDAVVRTFVKAEKVNFTAKPDPAPRAISPRDTRYIASVGVYLKPFEHNMFDAFYKTYGYNVICKGLNAQGVAIQLHENWNAFKRPVAIGLDASRFDQHVSVEALKFEHSYYNSVFNSPELKRLLSWQLQNHGVGFTDDGKITFTVDGRRMSGDINTSMGNCLIMSCIVLCYFAYHGIVARLANNGDDCVVFCEATDLPLFDAIDEWFVDFGFKLTREAPVYEFERIEFCQAQPVLTVSGWRMVRNPFTATSKDVVSLLSWNTEVEFDRWRGAIAECGINLTRGVPYWESFYKNLGAGAGRATIDDIENTGMGYMSRGVESSSEITPECRYSFWVAFGMTPDEQVALEDHSVTIKYGDGCPLMFGDITSYHPLLAAINAST